MTRLSRWCRALAVLLLSLSLPGLGGPGTRAAAAPGQETTIHLPIINARNAPPPVLANPSFEKDTQGCVYVGYTDGRGNQHPSGWVYRAWETGELLPLPYLKAGEQAVADGVGENIHKCFQQLPPDEWLGQSRALILDGNWTYKIFSDHLAYAVQLTQLAEGFPGAVVTATVNILGETNYERPGGGPLDPQHWLVKVDLGSQSEQRNYAQMTARRDITYSVRNWNTFVLSDVVPATGTLLLTVTVQSNWPTPVDFFLDGFRVSQVPPY